MSSLNTPKKISEAKSVYEDTIAKEKAEREKQATAARLLEEARSRESAAKYELERKKQAEHDNYIYSLKPATALVDATVMALEDPSNAASDIVCEHIAKTGQDDNIHIYGIRSNYGGNQFGG